MPKGNSKKKSVSALTVVGGRVRTPSDAQVVLNLTAFVAAGGGLCGLGNNSGVAPLTIVASGDDGHGNPGIGPLNGTPNGLQVKKNITISIGINDMTGTGPYSCAGLALVGIASTGGTANPDPTGKANFDQISWNGGQLSFRAKKASRSARWKLYVVIANYNQTPPTVGIIDPDIENDAQPFQPRDR